MSGQEQAIKRFAALEYNDLLAEVRRMMEATRTLSITFGESERAQLLPALMALKAKVSQQGRRTDKIGRDLNKPDWEATCYALGLTPLLIRQWSHRNKQTEKDLCRELGEKPKVNRKAKDAAKDAQALRHLEILVKEIIAGRDEKAEDLAYRLAEMYGFGLL
jgi:hypothetical protein